MNQKSTHLMEPWKLRQDDSRVADSLPTFIIFCEDEVSEPIYFKYFETSLIKVNLIEGQKSKVENVFKAIVHCLNEDMMQFLEGEQVLKNDECQVWCVFDRDREENDYKRQLGDVQFDNSISIANKKGIKVAWSNDSFELWILLHFEEVDPESPDSQDRKSYYERLTNIFKTLPFPNPDLEKLIKYGNFGYYRDLKRRSNFRSIVRDAAVIHTSIAIARAKLLEDHHLKSPKPLHEQSPSTRVHHLVEELIRLGKKTI